MSSIHIPPSWQLKDREATPEETYLNRRSLLRALGLGTLAMSLPDLGFAETSSMRDPATRAAVGQLHADRFPAERNPSYTLGERTVTNELAAAKHNNFYEFTTAKDRVWELAQDYTTPTWKVQVKGQVKKPKTLDLDDIFTRFPLEERLYRFRCVERWSMQIPWTGYPLKTLIDYLEPLPSANWVRFVSILDRKGMPGVMSQPWYPWPYFEALRLDEAMHELAFVAVGSYGHALPMQHGAPWRVAIPWKYGFKSPKCLVRIEFTKRRPHTFWNDLQPPEYGFYSNVEPHKPHPRWSQQWEQDIGTGETRDTLLYNGYGDQVASLYDGSEV